MDEFTSTYPMSAGVTGSLSGKIITLVQFAYGFPSFTLMIFFLVYLRHYPNSFYRLVQLDLLTNILCHINTWLAIRFNGLYYGVLLLTALERIVPGSVTFSHALINFFLHVQFMSAISLSIHRITSVTFYMSHDKFWNKWYLLYGLVSMAFGALMVFYVGLGSYYYIENDVLMCTYSRAINSRGLVVSAVCSISYFLLLFVVGISTAFLVSKRVKRHNISNDGIGKKLSQIALTYCGVFTGILLYTVVYSLNTFLRFIPDEITSMSSTTMVFASDMMTLALPYILLAFDKNVRRDLICLRERRPATARVFMSTTALN